MKSEREKGKLGRVNFSEALFGLLLFLQLMLVLGVMLGGIYLLSCLRRIATALENLAESSHWRAQNQPQTPAPNLAPPSVSMPVSAPTPVAPPPPATPNFPTASPSNYDTNSQ